MSVRGTVYIHKTESIESRIKHKEVFPISALVTAAITRRDIAQNLTFLLYLSFSVVLLRVARVLIHLIYDSNIEQVAASIHNFLLGLIHRTSVWHKNRKYRGCFLIYNVINKCCEKCSTASRICTKNQSLYEWGNMHNNTGCGKMIWRFPTSYW